MIDPQVLISAYFDRILSKKQAAELEKWIKEKPENARLFARLSFMHRCLRDTMIKNDPDKFSFQTSRMASDDSGINLETMITDEDLKLLMDYEKEAPEYMEELEEEDKISPEEVERRKLERSLELRRRKEEIRKYRQIQNHSLYVPVATAVICLLFIVIILLIPRTPATTYVATLTEATELKWGSSESPKKIGFDFKTGAHNLLQGIVKITFYNGAEIFLEAPSEINIKSLTEVHLAKGKLLCKVSKDAIGFIVSTPEASVVDYGTNFGVEVLETGEMEVRVFEGTVDFRKGPNPLLFEKSHKLVAGQIGQINEKGIITVRKISQDEAEKDNTYLDRIPNYWAAGSNKQQNLWNDSKNWTKGIIPDSTTIVRFSKVNIPSEQYPCIIDANHIGNKKATAKRVNIGLKGGPIYLKMTGGEAKFEELWIGRNDGIGIMTMESGKLELTGGHNSLYIGSMGIGATAAKGTLNMNGGNISVLQGDLVLGSSAPKTPPGSSLGTGTLNMQGGSIKIRGKLFLGENKGHGTLNLSGGTIEAGGLTIENGLININKGNFILEGNAEDLVNKLIKDDLIKSSANSTLKVFYDSEGIKGFGKNKTIIYKEK